MTQDKIQGGAMGGVDDLYREVILDHFKTPRNKGRLASANAHAEGMNPLCGDQITITASIIENQLKDVKFEGHGCAISQSAASMLTEAIKGKPIERVREIIESFKRMFGIEDKSPSAPALDMEKMGDLVSLEGVKKYPVRIKCAVLSSNTILQGIDAYLQKKGSEK